MTSLFNRFPLWNAVYKHPEDEAPTRSQLGDIHTSVFWRGRSEKFYGPFFPGSIYNRVSFGNATSAGPRKFSHYSRFQERSQGRRRPRRRRRSPQAPPRRALCHRILCERSQPRRETSWAADAACGFECVKFGRKCREGKILVLFAI